jgi:hypothetical protein
MQKTQAGLELRLCSLSRPCALSVWGIIVHILMPSSNVCQALQTRAVLFVLLRIKAA